MQPDQKGSEQSKKVRAHVNKADFAKRHAMEGTGSTGMQGFQRQNEKQ